MRFRNWLEAYDPEDDPSDQIDQMMMRKKPIRRISGKHSLRPTSLDDEIDYDEEEYDEYNPRLSQISDLSKRNVHSLAARPWKKIWRSMWEKQGGEIPSTSQIKKATYDKRRSVKKSEKQAFLDKYGFAYNSPFGKEILKKHGFPKTAGIRQAVQASLE